MSSEKFKPKKEDLAPITELLDLSIVTEDDLNKAIADWEDNPPKGFKNLLQAEVRDGY